MITSTQRLIATQLLVLALIGASGCAISKSPIAQLSTNESKGFESKTEVFNSRLLRAISTDPELGELALGSLQKSGIFNQDSDTRSLLRASVVKETSSAVHIKGHARRMVTLLTRYEIESITGSSLMNGTVLSYGYGTPIGRKKTTEEFSSRLAKSNARERSVRKLGLLLTSINNPNGMSEKLKSIDAEVDTDHGGAMLMQKIGSGTSAVLMGIVTAPMSAMEAMDDFLSDPAVTRAMANHLNNQQNYSNYGSRGSYDSQPNVSWSRSDSHSTSGDGVSGIYLTAESSPEVDEPVSTWEPPRPVDPPPAADTPLVENPCGPKFICE